MEPFCDEALEARIAEAWLAVNSPDEYELANGRAHVQSKGVRMMRIVGEFSACEAIGERLGGPDATAIWGELTPEWLALLCERVLSRRASHAQSDSMNLIAPRVLHASSRCAFLHRVASEWFKHRGNRCAGWAWDAWVCRTPNSQLKMVAILLKSITAQLVSEGRLDARGQTECPVDLHEVMHDPGSVTKWRSLHPCMHWICDACEYQHTQVNQNSFCPRCAEWRLPSRACWCASRERHPTRAPLSLTRRPVIVKRAMGRCSGSPRAPRAESEDSKAPTAPTRGE